MDGHLESVVFWMGRTAYHREQALCLGPSYWQDLADSFADVTLPTPPESIPCSWVEVTARGDLPGTKSEAIEFEALRRVFSDCRFHAERAALTGDQHYRDLRTRLRDVTFRDVGRASILQSACIHAYLGIDPDAQPGERGHVLFDVLVARTQFFEVSALIRGLARTPAVTDELVRRAAVMFRAQARLPCR